MTTDDDPEDDYRQRRARPGEEDRPMTRNDFRRPSVMVERHRTPSGHLRYALIVNDGEIAVSAHVAYDDPGRLMLASYNERSDYRPIRLTVAEATALRDALSLYLEDQTSNHEKN